MVNSKVTYSLQNEPQANIDLNYQVKAQDYVSDVTYQYHWIKQKENVLDYCTIDFDGFMKLTNQRLIVYEDQKLMKFPIQEVSNLEIGYKKFILPVIIGGIIAPLSLLAAFAGYFQFWIGMGLFITGLLLFYYGMQGGHQVIVHGPQADYKFFIDERTKQIEAFVQKTNQKLWQSPASRAALKQPPSALRVPASVRVAR